MLKTGMVARASDIDVVALHGQDFPRHRGGPMTAVTGWGLFPVAREMERLGHPDTEFWTPHPFWQERIKNGLDFGDV